MLKAVPTFAGNTLSSSEFPGQRASRKGETLSEPDFARVMGSVIEAAFNAAPASPDAPKIHRNRNSVSGFELRVNRASGSTTHLQTLDIQSEFKVKWQPVGESNPSFQVENLAS